MAKLKSILVFVLVVALASFSGCKTNDAQTGIVEPISKIALITMDTELETDFRYASVWEGVVSCGEANGISYGYYQPENMTEEKITAQFTAAISQGATVVISMGDEFAPVIAKMQGAHPNVKFIALDVSEADIGTVASNTHCVMFRQCQSGYLAGYGAVKDGFTKLGFLGDHKANAYSNYGYGFVHGANDAAVALNKNIEIKFGYISDYASREEALTAVEGWYAGGTEIILVSSADEFAGQCAQKAVDHLGYLIGTNNDQSYVGETHDYNPFMTSAMKGIAEGVDATLEMLLAGEWTEKMGGMVAYFGLQNGNYVYLPDSEGLWLFKDFTVEDYNTLKNKIAAGEIVVVGDRMPECNTQFVKLEVVTPNP